WSWTDARRLLENSETVRTTGGARTQPQPAHAPALLRHASAGTRRRPAGDSDDARACGSVHHPDLHPCAGAAHARDLRQVSSAGMIARVVSVAALAAVAAGLTLNLPPRSRELGAVPSDFGSIAR